MDYYSLKESLRKEVMQHLDFHKEWQDEEIADIIDEIILKRSRRAIYEYGNKADFKTGIIQCNTTA